MSFHGGGFVFGAPEDADWLCSQVCVRTRATIVSVDYRLAPEHPYPAAVTDCWEATRWACQNPQALGIDPERIVVMGESAGGTLAAVTALRARDAGTPRIALQVLAYPAVEMLHTFESERRHARGPIVTSAQLKGFARLYLADADGTEPSASPLRADDLRGVAPALILTAEHDPLSDHGVRYASALTRDGVPNRHRRYLGAVHGFLDMPGVVPAAHMAVGEIAERIDGAVG